ncbi:coproporphyrinogen-III oxidase family protein [Halobacteriovorax sp.]|uniref:coproporphyrinogen-III oxidase family protein n=1 Tax=Halobacteriovorax sp. TaxID=2020862 RepID=UPI003569AA03
MNKHLKDLLINFHSKGRRYSYYPSLPDWSGDLDKEFIIDGLDLEEINLYIHIPYCPSLCTFCGCNIKITKAKNQFRSYINKIIEEWNTYKLKNPKISLSSIYLGGGTPTYLELEDIKHLLGSIFDGTEVSPDFIGTLETDPRIEQSKKLEYLRSVGFNSISIGVQDTHKDTLLNVNRDQSFEQVKDLVNHSRDLGFDEINLDIIYGLPFQTEETFKETIEDIVSLSPDRIANYPLAKVPWQMDLQNALGLYKPLGTYEMYDLYIQSDEMLKDAGYNLLGMGHYSNKGIKYNRDITGYTRAKKTSLIALGTSGISNTRDYLYQNDKILEKYIAFPNAAIKTHKKSNREKTLEILFAQINCEGRLRKETLNTCFEENQIEKLSKNIKIFKNYDILVEDSDSYTTTAFGKHFNKTICQTIESI